MGTNLLSYQIRKKYDTTHYFHFFIFMYEGSELFIYFLFFVAF